MEIVILNKEKNISINLENNIIFFGENSNYKTKIIEYLKKGFTAKEKNLLINSKIIDAKDYNTIIIDEEADFSNEFKFTKSNVLKQIIYRDIIEKINEEKLINYTNEIFDIIDKKVNNLLDRKINKRSENTLSLQIEVPDVNSIIDKFTNIYIDNILLSDSEITKSMKRKLLYQLYFWEIENNKEKINIVIIENFDAYLDGKEIINILNKINSLSNKNCHFILTSCNNIFEYISLDFFSVYKITNNNTFSLNNLNNAIKKYLIRKEYLKLNLNITFEEYYKENEMYILDNEILEIKKNILNKYPQYIGKILNNSSIKLVRDKPKNITCDYLICDNINTQYLFLEIFNQFID